MGIEKLTIEYAKSLPLRSCCGRNRIMGYYESVGLQNSFFIEDAWDEIIGEAEDPTAESRLDGRTLYKPGYKVYRDSITSEKYAVAEELIEVLPSG